MDGVVLDWVLFGVITKDGAFDVMFSNEHIFTPYCL